MMLNNICTKYPAYAMEVVCVLHHVSVLFHQLYKYILHPNCLALRFVMSFGFKMMNHKGGIINWHGVVLKNKDNFVSGICTSCLTGNSVGKNPCFKWTQRGLHFTPNNRTIMVVKMTCSIDSRPQRESRILHFHYFWLFQGKMLGNRYTN